MKTNKPDPPIILDSARVLRYAILDQSVVHTRRTMMVVGGKVLGRVPRLAICKNLFHPGDFLLFYCNHKWRVLGAAGFKSLKQALMAAEMAYKGVSKKWQSFRKLSPREVAYVKKVRAFVRNPMPKGNYPELPRRRANNSIHRIVDKSGQ